MMDGMNSINEIDTFIGDDGLLYCRICGEATETYYPKRFPFVGILKKHPRMCACQRKQAEEKAKEQQLIRHLNEVERLRGNCFPDQHSREITFDASDMDSEAMAACRAYVEKWDPMRDKNTGLLLWGDVGSGKTHAAKCIANALIDREVSVQMLNLGQLLSADFDEKAMILKSIPDCGLLILDDFGTERNTDYGLEVIFQVIDRRYQSGRPLIITTNLSTQLLKAPGSQAH